MTRKLYILIGGALLVLSALCAIQYYLINTTYSYKREKYEEKLEKTVEREFRSFSPLDSLVDAHNDSLFVFVKKYYREKWTKDQLKDTLLNFRPDGKISKRIDSHLNRVLEITNANYFKILNSCILFDPETGESDTLIFDTNNLDYTILGRGISLEDAISFNEHEGMFSSQTDDEYLYKFYVKDRSFIRIEGWEKAVLQQMWQLFALALIILMTVIVLFILAFRALLKQKKIAEVKTDFVNNITHEFNTPLATLAVAAKILKSEQVKNDKSVLENTIESVERQQKRLSKLLEQVMTNSMDHKQIQLSKEKVEAEQWLNHVGNDFLLKTEEKIDFTVNIEVPGICIDIDKFHFTSALTNLLDNALKYKKEGVDAVIQLNALVREQVLHIEITDNGIGLRKKHQKLIFDKFYRVESGDIHTVKGLGLGLFYVKQIVKAHKGTIQLASEWNRGTTFKIELPLNGK